MEYKKTKEYLFLIRRITEIKKHFSFKQSITGITSLQSDRLRGLRLLCHAELEDYFESIALSLLNNAEKLWNSKRKANYNLSSLFISSDKINADKSCETKAIQCIKDYKFLVKNNNGIKEENIRKIFKPLGYTIDDFDTVFISTLSSFGSLRGETAHTSAKKAQQPLDFNTEINRINNIVENIVNFEQSIYEKI